MKTKKNSELAFSPLPGQLKNFNLVFLSDQNQNKIAICKQICEQFCYNKARINNNNHDNYDLNFGVLHNYKVVGYSETSERTNQQSARKRIP